MMVARPWLLLLLLALPAWWWFLRHRTTRGVVFSDVDTVAAAVRPAWWIRIPTAARIVALSAFVIGAAGLRVGGDTIEVKQEGIAIAIAIDVSSSMLAEDFAPSNRLEVAKEQATAFVRGRSADRIGLVAFAGEALTQVPVTLDYPVLERAIAELAVGQLEDGTAIGSGLATAVNRLRSAEGTSKVVLLLTDGENNRGLIDPRTAAQTAKTYGVKVYTIGAVGASGARRRGGFFARSTFQVDEPTLRQIAAETGGKYFRATDTKSLVTIYDEIDRLERRSTGARTYQDHTRAAHIAMLIALGLLTGEVLLTSTRYRRIP